MIPEDLILTTPPAYGAETARVVLDIITQFPAQHNQNVWGYVDPGCGTVCCVAGWARYVHDENHLLDYGLATPQLAMNALDLDAETAMRLFHRTTRPQAVRALEYLAKGDPIDWDEVYRA